MMLIFVSFLAILSGRSIAPTKTRDLADDERELSVDGESMSFDEEDDYDDDEEVEDEFAPDNVRRGVELRNHYTDKTITIYWQGSNGESVKMNDIAPNGAITLNTYNGHEFYPGEEDPSSRLMEHNFVIKGNVKEYHIRPSDADFLKEKPVQPPAKRQQRKAAADRPKGAPHPAIKFLNTPTTSMNAKFRCFVPDPVHIWYDDKKGGLYQGLLTLGKEYTINTYQGHVFYFTNA
jgi:hypothetical protein